MLANLIVLSFIYFKMQKNIDYKNLYFLFLVITYYRYASNANITSKQTSIANKNFQIYFIHFL